MLRELKTATSNVEMTAMQHRLEKAEKEIRKWKDRVHRFECQINQKEGELKKEGEFMQHKMTLQHAI